MRYYPANEILCDISHKRDYKSNSFLYDIILKHDSYEVVYTNVCHPKAMFMLQSWHLV